jgi:polysaccharide biosynthesis/export protein
MKRLLGILALLTVILGSCTVNKNLMFKTDREYQFDTPPYIDSSNVEYRIAPNDFITLYVFTNGASLLLEITTTSAERARNIPLSDLPFLIDPDGNVELPVVGVQHLAGMTINEAQAMLVEKYRIQYNNPFIILRVINRRVMVFPGSGGEGRVVPLANPNISVVEAIALAGGVARRGNASKIKLIRNVNEKQEVYLIDMSTIDGIRYANMPVEAGDIIYVEPVPEIAREILQDVQPVLTLITSLTLAFFLFAR